jgi:hypothetical protein
MFSFEILVCERLGAVDTCTTRSITIHEIAPLAHEILDLLLVSLQLISMFFPSSSLQVFSVYRIPSPNPLYQLPPSPSLPTPTLLNPTATKRPILNLTQGSRVQ